MRDGRWRTWARRPAAALRGVVRSYHGFVVTSGLPTTDRVPPATTVTLVLSFGDRLHLRATTGGNHRDGSYGSYDYIAEDPEGNVWSFGSYGGATEDG